MKIQADQESLKHSESVETASLALTHFFQDPPSKQRGRGLVATECVTAAGFCWWGAVQYVVVAMITYMLFRTYSSCWSAFNVERSSEYNNTAIRTCGGGNSWALKHVQDDAA